MFDWINLGTPIKIKRACHYTYAWYYQRKKLESRNILRRSNSCNASSTVDHRQWYSEDIGVYSKLIILRETMLPVSRPSHSTTCTHGRFRFTPLEDHVVFAGTHKTRSFSPTWTPWDLIKSTLLFNYTLALSGHATKHSRLLHQLQTCLGEWFNCPTWSVVR